MNSVLDSIIQLFLFPPIPILLGTVVVVLGLDLLKQAKETIALTAVLGEVLALGAMVVGYLYIQATGPIYLGGAGGTGITDSVAVIDNMSLLFGSLFMLVGMAVIIVSIGYMKEKADYPGVYYSLIVLATVGATLISMSTDFITLFITWESLALPSFALVTFLAFKKESSEAGLKYFILGGASAALMIYGISLLYGVSGSTNLVTMMTNIQAGLAENVTIAPLVLVGVVCLLAGFGFEMAAVPFQWWIPETYQGAPTPITMMLAAGSKKAAFAASFRVFLVPLAVLGGWNWGTAIGLTFAFVAVLTMTLGNVGALLQTNMKRLLAYSSIGQAGYILIAVTVFSDTGMTGGILHIISHTIMNVVAFSVVAFFIHRAGRHTIEEYKGIGRQSPWMAAALGIAFLSLAGIPPLFGFWTKFYLFFSAVEAGYAWLAFIAVLNSAISLYYYARVIKYMFVDQPEIPTAPAFQWKKDWGYALPSAIGATAIVAIGLFPNPLIVIAQRAATVALTAVL